MNFRALVLAGTLAVGSWAMATTPAAAAEVDCDPVWGSPNGWNAMCHRNPADGDDGGVSGVAQMLWKNQTSNMVDVHFKAYGDDFGARNGTRHDATVSAWRGKKAIFHDYSVDAGKLIRINKSLREGQRITIQVCFPGGGCATTKPHLRS